MAKYINIPFAKSGNKTAIPDTTTDGTVNYTEGFGTDYARPLGTDPLAKTVDRETINQALYDYGTAIEQLQENGFFTWQSTKAGGYDIGAAVSYNGVNYTNTVAGNTAAPDVSGWTRIIDEKQITGSTPLKDLNADIWTGTSRDTLVASLRSNVNINGGGVITWDSNGYFNATKRFIVISNGRGAFFSTNGYFDIIIPTSGTIQGVGMANVTATSAGVPFTDWQALYYILPIGSNNPSIASNFRIVYYTSDVVVPDNWVLLAVNNLDTNTLSIAGGKYTLHKGESIDTTKYSSAFVPNADLVRGLPADFTSSKATNGYQKLPSGLIIQWGWNNVAATTLPITFPNVTLSVVVSKSYNTLSPSALKSGQNTTYSVTTSSFTAEIYDAPSTTDVTTQGYFWTAIGY